MLGLNVTQGSGSSVNLKNAKGNIDFRQPHPDPIMDPIMLLN
jgi:hypothetical protein